MTYFFEKACAISGYILGVNPFDQPGVEEYKKNMFALLGKPGFEELRKELNKDGSGTGNSLNPLLEELKKQEEDIINKRLNSGSIKRQQEILTRLLESDKAIK